MRASLPAHGSPSVLAVSLAQRLSFQVCLSGGDNAYKVLSSCPIGLDHFVVWGWGNGLVNQGWHSDSVGKCSWRVARPVSEPGQFLEPDKRWGQLSQFMLLCYYVRGV